MDKRRESRVEKHIRFFVHVSECDADPELVGTSIACTGVDFSPHGLQLKTEHALPVDTVINITIGIGEPFAMYLLAGEVRWARVTDSGSFMGVLLKDREGTEYSDWVDRLYELFTPAKNATLPVNSQCIGGNLK